MTRTILIATVALAISAAAFSSRAQTNAAPAPATSNSPAGLTVAMREQSRSLCIAGRRTICGKILKIFPNGLLVESGYTDLLRQSVAKKSWVVPATVVATPPTNLVEAREPGTVCVGTIFLTDLPPRGKPHQYDYVVLTGYPAGTYTYTSVGTIQKTVRRFSANLNQAVKANLAVAGQATK